MSRDLAQAGASPSNPKPFLKWAGGKTQLLDQFAGLYPQNFDRYLEPFVGSAAVYFHLVSLKRAGMLGNSMTTARLSDTNAELVNCYVTLRDHADALIAALTRHRQLHSKRYYYQIRQCNPTELTAVARAARLIYLNKTCFNGLYRENRRGQFNVPMGSYTHPRIFDPDVLHRDALALRQVDVAVADFRQVVRRAQRGDFVYFDPPYHPRSKTASFTAYTQNAFGETEQRELCDIFKALDRTGCRVMLSNSWTPLILELYRDYAIVEVKAKRSINSQADKRGKVSEVVVLNYAP